MLASQLSYVFITELLYGRALATNFDMMTSTRWLTTPPYTGITAIAYQGCRACAVMRPGEARRTAAQRAARPLPFKPYRCAVPP
eukprot:3362648-Prymnesium_polylepis.1